MMWNKESIQIIGILVLAMAWTSCSAPKAIFNITEKAPTAPAIIAFENESVNADRYEWDFGDGNTSNEEMPKHRYVSSGNYTITLKAYKEDKAKTAKQMIQVGAPEICLVELTTTYGTMLIELYDDTPLHRDNFSKLAEEGFFDDLLFHRVINGFMIQGGDPESKNVKPGARLGGGGPDYNIPQEINTNHIHQKGALAAARQPTNVNPDKASNGSQYYIVHGKEVTEDLLNQIEIRNNISYSPDQRKAYLEYGGYPPLDNEYTIFGRVVEGLDVIDKIAAIKTDRFDRPVKDVSMKIILIK